MPVGHSDGQRFSCVHLSDNGLKAIIYAQKPRKMRTLPRQIPTKLLKRDRIRATVGSENDTERPPDVLLPAPELKLAPAQLRINGVIHVVHSKKLPRLNGRLVYSHHTLDGDRSPTDHVFDILRP